MHIFSSTASGCKADELVKPHWCGDWWFEYRWIYINWYHNLGTWQKWWKTFGNWNIWYALTKLRHAREYVNDLMATRNCRHNQITQVRTSRKIAERFWFLRCHFFLTQTQSLSEFCQSSSLDIHWLCIIELRSWRLSILQGPALFPSTSHNQKIDFQHFVGVWSSYPCHFLKAWKHISKICLAVHPSNLKLAFLPDIWCFDMVMDTFGVLPKTHQLCPSWQTGL